jgi:phenylalanyl-tRNA synthetase beta chain
MQFPLSWLKSLFPHHVCSKTIEDTLTKAGIEVDLVERFSPPFSGVVCAQVEEVSPHPDATKLQVAQVFDGKTRYQVVCGAKNCRKGLITAFAKPGAILGQKDPLIIAERAVRGVHSQGMLCSLDELGLCEEAAEGIVELDGSYPLGADFFSLLEDEIFHISITPNLGHVLSLVGIARELSAFLKLPYIRTPHIHLSTQELSILNIEIDSKECLCYGAMRLSDVTRTETPFLMQHRLRLAGFNPKSLLVDVLNYVMFEHGQPMHAFNAEKLKNKALIIKNLTEPTDFVALNGKTYICPKGLLAIQSGPHIAAVAGVMGSLDSSCDQQTHSVILESAYFTPQAVRRSLKELDLRTESANRFEKGIDPQSFESTLLYATDLIMKLTGAKASGYFKKTGDFKKLKRTFFQPVNILILTK